MNKLVLLLIFALLFFSCTKQSVNPEALPNSYSNQAVGASAKDMLTDSKYTTLNIQVQYMPGYMLDTATISNVYNYLSGLVNKPGGINITQVPVAENKGSDTLNVSQVAEFESQNRTAYTSGNNLAVYILVTNGFDTSLNVLGFAFRNTSICLFGQDIFNNSGAYGQVTRVALESSVLEHEFGHIMGLVNLGTPMVEFHQDTVHGPHCINPNCLMYYAVETHKAFGFLSSLIPALDSNCKKDLLANGGK